MPKCEQKEVTLKIVTLYIGESSEQLKERKTEHRKVVEKSKETSDAYLHVHSTGHSFISNDISVAGK